MLGQHMGEALAEASRALVNNGEVPVGCVFIYEGDIIASHSNDVNATKNPTRHAELVCVDQVLAYCTLHGLCSRSLFPQVSVVVTVEPCIMCSAALHSLGIKEIIYGCQNDRFGGKTVVNVPAIMQKEIPIHGGVRAEEAMELLKTFYKGENPSAPVAKPKR